MVSPGATMDVAEFLRKLGLEQYAPAFRENKIGSDLLPRLTAEDLKDLGVTLVGDRRVLLDAIARLREPTPPIQAGPEAPATLQNAGHTTDPHSRGGRTPAGHGGVLRPGRLHGAVGTARPGGSARADRRLSPMR